MVNVVQWVKDRVMEMSTWSGGALIGLGALVVFGGPFIKIAGIAAMAWGVISIIKKERK